MQVSRDQPKNEPPDTDHDVAMQEYLRSLDLQRLNLDHIELDDIPEDTGNGWPRWLIAIGLLVLLFWVPTTNYYQLYGQGFWLIGLAVAAVAAVGFGGAQQLINLAATLTGQPTSAIRRFSLPRWRVPPAVLRWVMLFGGVGLGSIMLFAMPREAEWQGHGYSGRWFVGVGVAITAGILLGRWLIMQADHKGRANKPRVPIVLPPWVKWLTLSVLVAAGLFAAFGHHVLSGDPDSNSFALGGVGFLVGILGAIWLARRFDEVEAQIRAQKRRE